MEKSNFTTKLNEACSTDPLRPIMNCVHFANGWAFASNAHIVVRQSLEYHSILQADLLDGKSLHRDNYKAVMQFQTATANDDGIECKDSDGREAFFSYYDRKDENIPNFDAVFTGFKPKGVDFIGFSPEHMKMIMAALYSPFGYVRCSFAGIDRGIWIDVPGIDRQEAILIPALIEPTLF